jgi:hypothetical protein
VRLENSLGAQGRATNSELAKHEACSSYISPSPFRFNNAIMVDVHEERKGSDGKDAGDC